MENALDEAAFPEDKYASIAVINMDATWLPNTFIASALEEKQKKFPRVTYVKDLKKVLVEKWSLKDDDYDVLVFDKKGQVVFSKAGVLGEDDVKAMIDVIRKHLDDKPES
jgi:predicted transcriptional regulator